MYRFKCTYQIITSGAWQNVQDPDSVGWERLWWVSECQLWFDSSAIGCSHGSPEGSAHKGIKCSVVMV